MTPGRRPTRLPLAIALFFAAGRLSAQTLPVPALPEAAAEREAPPSLAPPSWEYALGVGASWESNIEFLVPDGLRGLTLAPRGSLSRVLARPHGQLRATAAGSWIGTRDETLRRYNADVGLDGAWHPSATTSWRANASYGLGYSDSSRILLEQGAALPVVKTRSLSAALGLVRKVGARTSLRVDGRFFRTEFDSAALIDGQSLRGTMGLQRQLDPRSTAALEYSAEYVPSGQTGQPYLSHFGSLQWTRVLSLRSALLLEAGGSYTRDAARAGLDQKAGLFGGGSFTRQVKRSSLTAFVRREVAPAFGTGTSRLELRVGLGASIPMGKEWTARLAARHVQPENPRPAVRLQAPSDEVFASLARRLGGALELSGEARYRRRGAALALPPVEAFQAGVFLTLIGSAGTETVAAGPLR